MKFSAPIICGLLLLLVCTSHAMAREESSSDTLEYCIKNAKQDPITGDAPPNQRKCIGIVQQKCLDNTPPEGLTTARMAQCAYDEHAVWDIVLNAQYQTLLTRFNAQQQTKIREAQRSWIDLRDKKCSLSTEFNEGTIYIPMRAECIMRETAQQYLYLRNFEH